MNTNTKFSIRLLCAGLLLAGFTACSSDSDSDNNSGNGNGTEPNELLMKVTGEEVVSVDDVVASSFTANETNALPEDLILQEENKRDVLAAAQQLNDQYSGGNGTYHRNVSVKVVTLNYRSIDGNGDPITLSGKLSLPMVNGKYITIENILLNCHATYIDLTGKGVSNATFKEMAAYSYAVVDPDYIGFGITSDKYQTYLCHKLIARQCVDMELAALEYMQQEGVELKDGYGTYVVGYSQGGGNSMAVGRHLTVTDHGQTANAKVNLKGLYCGAGPYTPIGTFNHWLQTDSLCLTPVLSMVIKGQQEGHADIMRGIQLASYFSDEYLKSGVPQAFESNDKLAIASVLLGDASLTNIKYPEPEVKTAYETCLGLPWMQFSKIISDEFANPTSHIRTALLQCLEMERVDDWTPQVPVEIFTAPRDNVIPVQANAYNTYEKFRAAGVDVTLTQGGYLCNHITGQIAWSNHVKAILKKL